MKIAQVAPLYEGVPLSLPGGTGRIVSYLTEELVRQGHEVTLFASEDTLTSAELVAPAPRALRLDQTARDGVPHHLIRIEQVRHRADEFDVIHLHTDLFHMPLARALGPRTLTTLHGRLDLPDLQPFHRVFSDLPLVSVSDDQRRPMPPVHWVGTVPPGLPVNLLPYRAEAKGGYLAFLGRISPEQRPDRAIEIAARAGWPLRIAARMEAADQACWGEVVRPLIERHGNVEFVGEIDEAEKADFLGDAAALLFPISWPEPFGLVMIEAMSCGTPVIAFDRGSVPEVIDHGVSGLIVQGVDEAVEAVGRIGDLDRAAVRRTFVERFSAARMARDYERVYEALVGRPDFVPPTWPVAMRAAPLLAAA